MFNHVFFVLQEGLEYMKKNQLSGIADRLKYFTKQNLHNVLSRIPTKTFEDSLVDLNVRLDIIVQYTYHFYMLKVETVIFVKLGLSGTEINTIVLPNPLSAICNVWLRDHVWKIAKLTLGCLLILLHFVFLAAS